MPDPVYASHQFDRRLTTVVAVAWLLLGLSACRNAETIPQASVQEVDKWGRMRECSAQADLFARERPENTATEQVTGWRSHYNDDFEHCFVLLDYVNPKSESAAAQQPYTFKRLWDPFERRLVAVTTTQPVPDVSRSTWCRQTDEHTRETTSPACEQVGKYIEQLLGQP